MSHDNTSTASATFPAAHDLDTFRLVLVLRQVGGWVILAGMCVLEVRLLLLLFGALPIAGGDGGLLDASWLIFAIQPVRAGHRAEAVRTSSANAVGSSLHGNNLLAHGISGIVFI